FVAGAGTDDKIDVSAFANIHTLADILAGAIQAGANTVINFGNGDTITLQNVLKTSLSADDFVFVNQPPAILSNGGGDTATVAVPENSTVVTTVVASDPDAGTTL